MAVMKKHSPTNKEFKRNFQGLAGTAPKKGHLTNQEKKADDIAKENGILIRIDRDKIFEKGWEVEVGTGNSKTKYNCSYGSGVMYVPDFTATDKYLVPKKKTEVEITIDKKSKIYTVTKVNTDNKKPISLYNNILTLSTNTDEKALANRASITITEAAVEIQSALIKLIDANKNEYDLVESQKKIDFLEKQNNSLMDRVEILESKLNGE